MYTHHLHVSLFSFKRARSQLRLFTTPFGATVCHSESKHGNKETFPFTKPGYWMTSYPIKLRRIYITMWHREKKPQRKKKNGSDFWFGQLCRRKTSFFRERNKKKKILPIRRIDFVFTWEIKWIERPSNIDPLPPKYNTRKEQRETAEKDYENTCRTYTIRTHKTRI